MKQDYNNTGATVNVVGDVNIYVTHHFANGGKMVFYPCATRLCLHRSLLFAIVAKILRISVCKACSC